MLTHDHDNSSSLFCISHRVAGDFHPPACALHDEMRNYAVVRIAQIPLGSSRHVSTRPDTFDVSNQCILAVLSLSNITARHARRARLDALGTSNVSCRVETWRDEPSGIWAYTRIRHTRSRTGYRHALVTFTPLAFIIGRLAVQISDSAEQPRRSPYSSLWAVRFWTLTNARFLAVKSHYEGVSVVRSTIVWKSELYRTIRHADGDPAHRQQGPTAISAARCRLGSYLYPFWISIYLQKRTGFSNRPWISMQTGLISSGVTRNSGIPGQPNRGLFPYLGVPVPLPIPLPPSLSSSLSLCPSLPCLPFLCQRGRPKSIVLLQQLTWRPNWPANQPAHLTNARPPRSPLCTWLFRNFFLVSFLICYLCDYFSSFSCIELSLFLQARLFSALSLSLSLSLSL